MESMNTIVELDNSAQVKIVQPHRLDVHLSLPEPIYYHDTT